MLSFGMIVAVLITHWFADFILQTDWQAKNKSKDNWALFKHVSTYTLAWALFAMCFVPHYVLLFLAITFLTHFATDWITSRVSSALWANGDVHNFFVCVGFDQFIHYVTLFGTYILLVN